MSSQIFAKVLKYKTELDANLRGSFSFEKYVSRFNKSDLIARKLTDRNKILPYFVSCMIENPVLELTENISKVTAYCENMYMKRSKMENFFSDNCKFCITNGVLEDGMPFTLSDIIFLPQSIVKQCMASKSAFKHFCHILMHEACHIFQRKYEKSVIRFIREKWNFSKVSDFEIRFLVQVPIRTNPDTCEVSFVNSDGQSAWAFVYSSTHPSSLKDGTTCSIYFTDPPRMVESKFEHPYEMMADMVPSCLMEGSDCARFTDDDVSKWYTQLCDWMLE